MSSKKAIVRYQDLPPVSSDNSYKIRYRIISEDKNRLSHWSPIVEVSALAVTGVDGVISFDGQVSGVVWGDENNRPSYDVFVGFDGSSEEYHGTTAIHSYSFIVPPTSISISVIIQIASNSKTLSQVLEIFTDTYDI